MSNIDSLMSYWLPFGYLYSFVVPYVFSSLVFCGHQSTFIASKSEQKERLSRKEHDYLRSLFRHECFECSDMLASKAANGKYLSENDLIKGLEESITALEFAERVRQTKQEHHDRVLGKQNRQIGLHIRDEEMIAQMSRKSSHDSRVRSHKIAV